MAYERQATVQNPALIVYLIDVSASMASPLGDRSRIEVVSEALQSTISQMLARSTRGSSIFPRYRIAMFAYSDAVYDILDGVRSIEELKDGFPELTTLRTTQTSKAFVAAERLLRQEWAKLRQGPAPLICHLTDGEYTGDDPEPVARNLQAMLLPDGAALVENIYISDDILPEAIEDPYKWSGIFPSTRLASDYARKLRDMSSPLPESYRSMLTNSGYGLEPGCLMLLPGTNRELVALGYQMSASTRL
ncbi:VWA domain-containing protein [bacterium]|nr:VWA domain-containing protein [bacterium]